MSFSAKEPDPDLYRFPPKLAEWTDRERSAWTPPDDLSVSEWADKHRVLHPLTSAEPGRWNTDRTPYLREILDSFSDPSVERLTVMASTQVGKTESILNMIAYAVAEDPGATLLVMPREEDVVSMGARRIKPMIESCPELSKYLSESKADNKLKEIRFHRSMLYLAGSNSPADLSSRPVRYVLGDEVDKWPAFSGREASPVDLMVERTRTFWNRKIVLTSTPTTRAGYIFKEYELSDQREYQVPCPHCDVPQPLVFTQVKFPEEERDPAKIRQERLAWYECQACGGKIGDLDKPEMLRKGFWKPQSEASAHRGYRINALYSPWLTWSEIAAKFLESKDDPASLMNFVNSWLGWIFEEKSLKIEEDYLKTRSREYQEGTVPEGGIVLTAGVDVQKDAIYYVVRAWGYREESWLVEAGKLEAGVENLIEALARKTWSSPSGKTHRLRLACIDSGYRTDEVYKICRRFSDVFRPIKGQQKLNGVPIRTSKIDRNIAGDPLKGSVRLYLIDTTHFKDKVTRLMTDTDGDGSWHLYSNVSSKYLRQVSSEHKVLSRNKKTGATTSRWVTKPGHAANHWFDCEVYATAAADMLAVYAMQESEPVTEAPVQKREESDWVRPRKGGWINGR